MHPRRVSPTVLLILLCAVIFLAHLSVLMLGPLYGVDKDILHPFGKDLRSGVVEVTLHSGANLGVGVIGYLLRARAGGCGFPARHVFKHRAAQREGQIKPFAQRQGMHAGAFTESLRRPIKHLLPMCWRIPGLCE